MRDPEQPEPNSPRAMRPYHLQIAFMVGSFVVLAVGLAVFQPGAVRPEDGALLRPSKQAEVLPKSASLTARQDEIAALLKAPAPYESPIAQGSDEPTENLADLVRDARASGLSEAGMEQMLAKVIAKGGYTVPPGLAGTDGKTDTKALLAMLTPTGASSPRPVPMAGPGRYVVRDGDSLARIAWQHYGRASAYQPLFDANHNILSDPDRIYIGQELLLPPLKQ